MHEAWIKLVGDGGEARSWQSRAHCFGAAAQAMRCILVERALRVASDKRGGRMRCPALEAVDQAREPDELDLGASDVASVALSAKDPRAARVVELRFFAGLAVEGAAKVLGISERTVAREWSVARAWLAREIGRSA